MTIEAKLRIAAQFDSAIKALRALRQEAVGVTTEAQQAGAGKQPFKPLSDGASAVGRQIAQLKSQVIGLFGITVGAESVRGLVEMADAYTALQARLRIATQGDQEFRNSLQQTRDLARQYQQPLADVTTLYTRQLSAVRPLGGGLREAAVATEALLAALKITGANAAESSAAVVQFTQALGAGTLRGEEFNSMADAAPRLLDALAAGLGKPKDQLRALAEQGQLTTSAVVQALAKELPNLRKEAAQIPATIGGAARQAGDAFATFVGRAAEGSRLTQALVSGFQSLAQNIEPVVKGLATMAALLGALKLATFAQGLAAAGAAGASGALGITAAGVALRGVLSVLAGPVGLIVFLGSLAAAWVAVGAASEKATRRGVEQVQADLAAARQRIADAQGATAPQARLGQAEDRAKVRRLEAELAAMQRQSFEDARRTDLAGYGDQNTTVNLRDPATVRAFEAENKSRAQIVKKFADERAAYVIAKDKEIAAARLAGDAATEARLADEKRAALAVQADAEKDALRKFTADETLTRIAQVKERYSLELALLQDRIGREAQLNQEQFDAGLRDLATYLAERGRLEEDATASELQQLQTKLAEQRRVLALNESRAGSARTANEQEQLRETILQQQQDVLRTETEIEKKKRDQVDAARQLANEAERYRRELAATLRGVEQEIAQIGGTETAQQIEARVTAALLPTLERVKQLGGDASRVFLLIDMTVQQEQFRQAERAYADYIERLQLLERGLDDQVQMGALTTVEAEAQKFQARARALPQLREMLSILNATAQTEGDRNRITQITQDLDRLADRSTELERTMRSSIGTGIGQALTDVQLRSKTAGEAIRGFFSDIARSALNVVNQRLGEQIANTLFPKAGSGDGFMGYVQQLFSKLGSWVTELFSTLGSGGGGGGGGNFLTTAATWVASLFHTGGLVGQSSGMSRAVSPAAWAYAPRYHTEGIVGLKPRERAIIALDGEEVLREDNPRHIKNFGRTSSVGNVDISVAVQVTSGDQAQAKASGDAMAQDLAQMVDARISTWAAREQRPGGVLQQGGRR